MGLLLEDIAKKAGVSTATISRVLNNRAGVSAEKAQRVMSIIKELDYKPTRKRGPAAMREPRAEVRNISFLTLDMGYTKHPELFVALLQGVNAAAQMHNAALTVTQVTRVKDLPRDIVNGQVDGLLLTGSQADKRVLEAINHVPSVWLSSHAEWDGDKVLAGNEEVGKLAANYLAEHGHKNVAFFNALPGDSITTTRCNGFIFAANLAGIKVHEVLGKVAKHLDPNSLSSNQILNVLRPMIAQFGRLDPRPTALFIFSDRITALAQPLLVRKGIVPGKDIEIVSADNEQTFLLGLDPCPVTIDLGHKLMGKQAVEQLIRRIKSPAASEEERRISVSIQPELVYPKLDFGAE